MGNLRRLLAALVYQYFDHRILARHQQPRPVSRDLAPNLIVRARAHERALGAIALNQSFDLENVERLADSRARNTAFSRELFDGRDLRADLPLSGLDATAKQARKLDIARHRTAAEIDDR